jgi:hypothetical protein
VDYWISGYVRTSKNGRKFLSLSVKPKVEKPAAPAAGKRIDMDDQIPFAAEWG